MELILQKLIEWGPGGVLAAIFGFIWLKERERCDAAMQRINELQDKRVLDTRDDVGKMTAALAASTDAIESNTASIATLTRVVEARTDRSVR
jgi:uncharacterized protein YerC